MRTYCCELGVHVMRTYCCELGVYVMRTYCRELGVYVMRTYCRELGVASFPGLPRSSPNIYRPEAKEKTIKLRTRKAW